MWLHLAKFISVYGPVAEQIALFFAPFLLFERIYFGWTTHQSHLETRKIMQRITEAMKDQNSLLATHNAIWGVVVGGLSNDTKRDIAKILGEGPLG